jgi:hypothetical protein
MSFNNQSSVNEKHSLQLHIHEQSQKNEHNTNFLKGNAFFMWTHYNVNHFGKCFTLLKGQISRAGTFRGRNNMFNLPHVFMFLGRLEYNRVLNSFAISSFL